MEKRNIAKIILLSLITLGIYQLFWLKWTSDEMRAMHIKVPALKWLIIPIIAYVVLAGGATILFEAATNGQPADSPAGFLAIPFIFFLIILVLAFWIAQAVWYWFFGKSIEQATRGQMTAGTSFLLVILLSFFGVQFAWPGIIQDSFNKVGPAPAQPQPKPTPPAAS